MFLLLLFFVSCGEKSEIPESLPETGGKAFPESTKFNRVQDSVLKSYASAVRLINQIDDELTKLANVPNTIETQNLERDILQKIEYLSFQLKTKDGEIKNLQAKLKSLTKGNKELAEKIATLEILLAEKDKTIVAQKDKIAGLEGDLTKVSKERDVAVEGRLLAEKVAEETTKEKNTAYYIIGSEDDLKERKIIKMEGEGFLGIGGRYVPAPDANINFFKKVNILQDTLLSFPNNFKIESIISTHNKKYIDIIDSPSGEAFLKVKNPETFWQTDKTLIILIEKE
jgi:peptidoglycan hydrolase CwlO-like protein